MPPHRHRLDEPRDDVWKENEAALRRLYLKERKTLKDVKRAMESKHGFPTTPLSTYESKLRDLGLRKKMKRKDWHPVYQDYVNSGHRHTAMFFNGVRIPWDKAWKEIRRSGARDSHEGPAIDLPADVVMRTPSPVLVAQNVTPWYRPPIPWHLSDAQLEGLSCDEMFQRLRLYDTPSNLLRIDMLNALQQFPTDFPQESGELSYNQFSPFNSANSNMGRTSLRPHSTISRQSLKHMGTKSDIDRLSSALYRLTNGEVGRTPPGKPLDEPLEVIFNLTPNHILLQILESESPTVRSAVTNMIKYSSDLGRANDVRNISETVGRCHPEWILDDRYLIFAVRVSCANTCRLLLRLRMRHLSKDNHTLCPFHHGNYFIEAVLEAVARGHIECAKILCQHMIELNPALLHPEDVTFQEIFCSFLDMVICGEYGPFLEDSQLPFGLGNSTVLHIINWLLEVGANVDLPVITRYCHHFWIYIPKNGMYTILDSVCLCNRELYSHLVGHSVKLVTEPTRTGIYLSAKQGIDSLRLYLLSWPSHTPPQHVFVDTLRTVIRSNSMSEKGLDFNVVHTLLCHIIDLPGFALKRRASNILYYVVRAARLQGIHPAVHHIIKILIQKGAVISPEVMDAAVNPTEGTTLLQLLSSFNADFKSNGAAALCAAMKLGNYDAVSWLLDIGVDINATLRDDSQYGSTILALASQHDTTENHRLGIRDLCFPPPYLQPISCTMLEYLISQNIVLRAYPSDRSSRHLIRLTLQDWLDHQPPDGWAETLKKIQLLLDAEALIDNPPSTEPCLLEACFPYDGLDTKQSVSKMLLFMDLMLEYGVPIRRSGVLAHLVYHCAPRDKIQRVLDSGVDVNAYCGQGLRGKNLLVQRGANVNQPAKGCFGKTALQAACEYGGNTNLIKFLIANGADINAPPVSTNGITAFQAAAANGNFEVALLLLDNGADINAPGSREYGYSALDGAAYYGKLDMVQFLLDLGALSDNRGESGYRGAIYKAERCDTPVIADMIRQHALKHGKSGEELFTHYKKWEHKSGDHESSSDDEDEGCERGNYAGFEESPPLE
ncbi:hypothetical protein GGR58DRAFT_506614 [Xylaria digitata]|nr:hypothetical protein GGR58DRAFT_506614 [Xylaria digitata]